MEKRSWRIARRNGFTAIETVVTVVVLAILAAYAAPKLFGLKEQADATEETLKIKDIEARHTQEILKAGKRGVNPTLGDVVGFRPEVTAEPAPDTAPMRVSYSFNITFPVYIPGTGGQIGAITVGYDSYGKSNTWTDPDGDGISGCEELENLNWNAVAIRTTGKGAFGLAARGNREDGYVAVSPIGNSKGVLPSDPIPVCQVDSFKYNWWISSPAAGYEYFSLPPEVTTSQKQFYLSTNPTHSVDYGAGGLYDKAIKIYAPVAFSYDCRPYSLQYGVPYRISGAASLGPEVNGREYSKTTGGPSSLSLSFTTRSIPSTSSPVLWETVVNNPVVPATHVCERIGPAPAVPPSDPGDPGAYPMAQDGSGYCLSPGRKLPTYKDGSGTPTGSSSDPVVELATEAMDDPTNCPG